MKQIKSFDDCFEYVNRLGVVHKSIGTPGWMPDWQKRACDLCDDLMHRSGNTTWYHKVFEPFRVKYSRKDGTFTVEQKGVIIA